MIEYILASYSLRRCGVSKNSEFEMASKQSGNDID
jgi:hypothetical protein